MLCLMLLFVFFFLTFFFQRAYLVQLPIACCEWMLDAGISAATDKSFCFYMQFVSLLDLPRGCNFRMALLQLATLFAQWRKSNAVKNSMHLSLINSHGAFDIRSTTISNTIFIYMWWFVWSRFFFVVCIHIALKKTDSCFFFMICTHFFLYSWIRFSEIFFIGHSFCYQLLSLHHFLYGCFRFFLALRFYTT